MNLWDKSRTFGVLKLETNKVKVYRSSQESSVLNISEAVSNAVWSGDSIIVTLSSGKIRKYTSFQSYIKV